MTRTFKWRLESEAHSDVYLLSRQDHVLCTNKDGVYQRFCSALFIIAYHLVYFCSLETNGRLMELRSNDGKLQVNYGERLVTLLREVRQLTSLGFAIPAKIQHVANVGLKFYRHGVILKQV